MRPNFTFAQRSYAWVEGEEIYVNTKYSEEFVVDCRNIEGRKWDNARKANVFPLSASQEVKALGEKWKIPMPTEVLYDIALADVEVPKKGPQVVPTGENISISFTYDPSMIYTIKSNIPNVRWDAKNKFWITNRSNIIPVVKFATQFGLWIDDSLNNEVSEILEHSQNMQKASSALTGEITIPNIAQDLLPYQKAGILYLKKVRKGILGDQPGLGKTAQALATVASENRFPMVVVCPNTLKFNWKREVEKFFPHLTVEILNGTKSCTIPQCDVIVVNYDILYERNPDIVRHGFISLVVDESHAIKNGVKKNVCPSCDAPLRSNSKNCKSCGLNNIKPKETWTVKRTAAVMQLAKCLKKDDFVLLLTGTPITNRPQELVPQLEAIGRLQDFGGAWRFKNRYAPKRNVAINTKELNEKLRETCFVRRIKKDVYTELPELRNAIQYLEVNPKLMRQYKIVEDDAVEHFAKRARELAEECGQNGDEAYWEKRMRLELNAHLITITALRDSVSKIKYDALVEWLDNFLESSDEKVIVFAEHIDLVEKLHERYKSLSVKVRGGVSSAKRIEAVDSFQNDPNCRMFLANMKAASEGLTLTAASDVVFCELAWTPATHEQCAGRAYGRANDLHGATAWYLLAPNTIDEQTYALLEKKKLVVNAVTDGVDVLEGASVVSDLVIELARRGMAK